MNHGFDTFSATTLHETPPVPLRLETLRSHDELQTLRNRTDVLLLPELSGVPYRAGLACSDRCIDAVLRLRYEVFNLELGEGLSHSSVSGLDRDEFDEQMTHLVLYDPASGRVIGTYRLQPVTHALQHRGIYSGQLFQFEGLEEYHAQTVELGRACLARDHRSLPAILALWAGIAEYLNLIDHHYVFGCCSLTSQDPDDGWRAMKTIRARKYLHPQIYMQAQPAHMCGPASREFDADLGAAIALPKLFRTYMRLGASVISAPAIDHDFGTVDFLVFLDGRKVPFSKLDIVR